MSDELKADLWRRWQSGESISVISRGIGKPPGSVFTVLKHHGGIAALPRRARAGSLTLGEREEISRRLCAGDSFRAVAGHLRLEGISPSIGSVGDAYDNALMETITGLCKSECIRTSVFHEGP